MLAGDWEGRKEKYDFAVIGSGYGGAILAARLSAADLDPKPSVCLLERGGEWPVGKFPDTLREVSFAFRHPLINPLGLYDLLAFSDIAVIQGSGLGGTSLVNANVAIVPDEEVLDQPAWPRSLRLAHLLPYYARAAKMLATRPHPQALNRLKVQALDRRAREIGYRAAGLNLAVNFEIDGPNAHGVEQKPCIDCGDCVTGCNVSAKNTLYMNYLPFARRHGCEIFTATQADWLEKLPGGGWRIHGRRFGPLGLPEKFTLQAGSVILAAGALGTPEILLRSELHGLSFSPRLGSGFTGNGDFFGLAYNSDFRTDVLGFGNDPASPWRAHAPGPTIVGGIRYRAFMPFDKRIMVEDLSFPKAYVSAAMLAIGALGGEDTDLGDEKDERARRLRDNPLAPYRADNAMNHTMLYLVMGHDDAKGTLYLRTDILNPQGALEIEWDDVGRQPVFARINEEIRRHARALGAHFISAPLWNFLNLRKLITAHPIGGCPLGEDYQQGAADEFGRVFSGDGSIHPGLFAADGSLIPTSLGVNPFLTISALCERIAERLIRSLKGEAYPQPPRPAAVRVYDPLKIVKEKEAELERIFGRAGTQEIAAIVNTGERSFDMAKGLIRNDTAWMGFFPRGHILNQLSMAFYAGFKKKFRRTDQGYTGATSDADERINVRNTLEEITLKERTGSLDPGRYILLRYSDPPWSAFYEILKIIGPDLLAGRVYLGAFPRGKRLFTFSMSRLYGLNEMTAADHQALYQHAPAPAKEQLAGLWEMRAVSNGRDTGVMAYLKFDLKPDGRLEARYRFLGLIEGMVEPVFFQDHFRMNDFTPFHDEIRFVDRDFLVGKYTAAAPPGLFGVFGPGSLGLLRQEAGTGGRPQVSFLYTLRRSSGEELPATVFLEPLLRIRLPEGLGMTFDEEMTGHLLPGLIVPPGREGDLEIEAALEGPGPPQGSAECSFQVHMTIRDLNEFFEGTEHEASMEGTIHFADFAGRGPAAFPLDPRESYFNYLRVNPSTGGTEMVYRLSFTCMEGKKFLLEGRKYLRKDGRGGTSGVQEILHDYGTLYAHLTETSSGREAGTALLKFKALEDLKAAGSMAHFFSAFQVTGTDDPVLKAEGLARFFAFTNRFVLREYDPFKVKDEEG